MRKIISLLLAAMLVIGITACGGNAEQTLATTNAEAEVTTEATTEAKAANPHSAAGLTDEMVASLDTIERLDDKGVLYEMDYTSDYYDETVIEMLKKATESISSGCSAFSVYNTDNDFMLCRSYDYRHKDADGNYTGLNVVIHLAPEGKLKSVNICDAFWLNPNAYFAGALDDGATDTSAMILSPYACVDGMNEAGLTASLLVVETKEGETLINQDTGKERATQSQLLRYIIDNAHDVEEAVEIAQSYDVYSTGGTDLHMYLSDKSGTSATFEWRQYEGDTEQKLYVTYTNAVTNFFVGFDDAQDSYNADGTLKELFSGFEKTYNNYKYGYGHGYHRFNEIIATLERYIMDDENAHGIRNSIMEEEQALDVLRVIAQAPGIEKTSFTQYSAIYNLEELSIRIWMQRDYNNEYDVTLN